jgi:hypothetical protein
MMPVAGEITAMGARKTVYRCAVCPTEVDRISKVEKPPISNPSAP